MTEEASDLVDAQPNARAHEIIDNVRQHYAEEMGVPLFERLDRAARRVLAEEEK